MHRFAIFAVLAPWMAGCLIPEFGDPTEGTPIPATDPPVAVLSLTSADPLTIGLSAAVDGTNSYDPDGEIDEYQWTLTEQPASSLSTLQVASSWVYLTPDVPGVYTIQLVVVDDVGVSSEPATVSFEAIPSTDDLYLVLTWDIDISDVDIHLINLSQNGQFFQAPFDCYYANMNPDWGPAGNVGNPALTLDDDDGYGPELLSLEEAEPGDTNYRVVVHYYSDDGVGDTNASIQVHVNGSIAYEDTANLTQTGRTWEVLEVSLPSGSYQVLDNFYDYTPF